MMLRFAAIYVVAVLVFFPLGFFCGYVFTEDERALGEASTKALVECERYNLKANDALIECAGHMAQIRWNVGFIYQILKSRL